MLTHSVGCFSPLVFFSFYNERLGMTRVSPKYSLGKLECYKDWLKSLGYYTIVNIIFYKEWNCFVFKENKSDSRFSLTYHRTVVVTNENEQRANICFWLPLLPSKLSCARLSSDIKTSTPKSIASSFS